MEAREAIAPNPSGALAQPAKLLGESPRRAQRSWFRLLLQNRAATAGIVVIVAIVLLALIVPSISPYDPTAVDPPNRLADPTAAHWLGTDQLGRDVLTRIIYGARVSLPVGVLVMLLGTGVGSLIGVLTGYYSRVDSVVMRIMDALMAFPGILLAIALVASLGAQPLTVVLAIAVVGMPAVARIVRSVTLNAKFMLYVDSARAVGVSDARILTRYLFPNALPVLIVQSTFVISEAIVAEAALAYLGSGIPPQIPTWGTMIHDGQAVITSAWWLAVGPSAMLFLTILSLNLIGDGLRDALDPRLRGQ
jgi:peptide/nickel transport system permease protein